MNTLAFSPTDNILACGSKERIVKLFDSITMENYCNLDGHKAGVRSVLFTPDGKLLISGSGDTVVNIWKIDTR